MKTNEIIKIGATIGLCMIVIGMFILMNYRSYNQTRVYMNKGIMERRTISTNLEPMIIGVEGEIDTNMVWHIVDWDAVSGEFKHSIWCDCKKK